MAEPATGQTVASDLADAHAAAAAALTTQLGMNEPTARHVAATVLAAAVPALPATVRSVAALTSYAAGVHLGIAIQQAVAAALTEERAVTGVQLQALADERDRLTARIAELEALPTEPVFVAVRAALVDWWPETPKPGHNAVNDLAIVAATAALKAHRAARNAEAPAGDTTPTSCDRCGGIPYVHDPGDADTPADSEGADHA